MQKPVLNDREKRILKVALLVGVILIISNGVPALRSVYAERAANLEQLRDNIAREQRLLDDSLVWQERRDQAARDLPLLAEQLFDGNTTPMLTAAIQRQLRQYATESGITITSTRLAESRESVGWLKVEQTVSFTLTDQNAIVNFLARLENSRPYLGVTNFSLRRARNQFSGDITVVGFARVSDARGS